ncbi:MAG: FAD-binding oxidoreductase [Rhizobiaceae bacterium]|nr:FAD-binding oxidoreductase [Rhizobiaceae bacterium]
MGAEAGKNVTVIGAGIIGVSIAARLAEAGARVTVIDRTGICAETSSGNAAGLAFTEILPMAHKGMIRKVPGWLSDPLGPLAIPPTYFPTLLPWLYRFWRAGSLKNYERAVAAQVELMKLAESEWMSLMDASGTRSMLREDGCLELYESEAEHQASMPGWEARKRAGIAFHHLQQEEIAQYQPGLSPSFVRATFVPGWKTVTDPAELGRAVWRHAESLGAKHVPATVTSVEQIGDAYRIRFGDGTEHTASTLVIAAGAWSHRLAAMLGDRIPLEAERGYHVTLPADAFDVRRQLLFSGHGFVITPLGNALRVGGTVEFGGLDRPPNYNRSKALLRKASEFLPGLKPQGGSEWMGHRPALPDSLPVIGKGSRPGLYYAFGHGHLGLTQAAATGSLIRDLVLGQKPPIALAPFAATRF